MSLVSKLKQVHTKIASEINTLRSNLPQGQVLNLVAASSNTWAFPKRYPTGTTPVVSISIASGTNKPYYARITSVTNTHVSFIIYKAKTISVLLLGSNIETSEIAIGDNLSVHITATKPS